MVSQFIWSSCSEVYRGDRRPQEKRLVLSEKPMATNQARGFYIQLRHKVPKSCCSLLIRQQLPGGGRCSLGFTVQEQLETCLVAQEHWDPTAASFRKRADLFLLKRADRRAASSSGGHTKLADISEMQIIIFYFIPHLWWNFFSGRGAVTINSLTSVKYRYNCTKCIAKAQEMIVNYIFSAGF